MESSRSDFLSDAFRAVRRLAREFYSDVKAAFIGLVHDSGRVSTLEVPQLTNINDDDDLPVQYYGRAADILAALREVPVGEGLIGKDLAKAAGWEENSDFRRELGRLTKAGEIQNIKNTGYMLTDRRRELEARL